MDKPALSTTEQAEPNGLWAQRAVWIESLCLGLLVAAVLVLGGNVVQTSYHGYLHATIGAAVGDGGLLPENPYHAGSPLRYYTLYPWLGHALGTSLGIGPIAAFACLNVLAACLFPFGFHALARSLQLGFRSRRIAFLLAVLGFNALGCLGWLWDAPDRQTITVPVFAFEALTFAGQPWGWDARLQAFLPKFLNASSFALALPLALWACAQGQRALRGGSAWAVAVPAGLALAINPLAGGFAGLCLACWVIPYLLRAPQRVVLAWLGSGALACALALPFLLPAFHAAPPAESLTGQVRFQHSGWMNVLGPCALLLLPFGWGLARLDQRGRRSMLTAVILAVALGVFARLPWGNEYKLARIAGVFLALPAGVAVAQWSRRIPLVWLWVVFGIATTGIVVREYGIWGQRGTPPALQWQHGQWQAQSEAAQLGLPSEVLAAVRAQPREEVLWTNLVHPGLQSKGGVVQGHAFAPAIARSLFVDLPQIHNEGLPDLADRLIACVGRANLPALFGAERAARIAEQASGRVSTGLWEGAGVEQARVAVQWARQELPERALLVLCHERIPYAVDALRAEGASCLIEQAGISLWRLQPWNAAHAQD